MTFDELNTKLGGGEKQDDWRQASGGGWLHKSAKVENESLIKDNAIVSGDAQVSGDAWVYGNALVSGDARVFGDAQVYGNAQVYDNARVYGDARVSGNARVYGNARVSGNAQVYGNAWEKSPLFIIGSRYSLTNCKHGHIQIGCHCHTFAWWQSKEAEALAKEQGFTPEEVEEYRAYIELFVKVGK